MSGTNKSGTNKFIDDDASFRRLVTVLVALIVVVAAAPPATITGHVTPILATTSGTGTRESGKRRLERS